MNTKVPTSMKQSRRLADHYRYHGTFEMPSDILYERYLT